MIENILIGTVIVVGGIIAYKVLSTIASFLAKLLTACVVIGLAALVIHFTL